MLALLMEPLLWIGAVGLVLLAIALLRVLPLLAWDLITKGHLRDWRR